MSTEIFLLKFQNNLLSICGKIYKKIIFNSLFECLEKCKLLSARQSGFRANDSYVDQWLSIFHNIYTVFDAYPALEYCGVFLFAEAFNKVWHEGFIFKLESMVISDASLDLIGSFLENRFQRVVLNGQTSE